MRSSWCSTSARALSSNTSSGTPPKCRNAASKRSNRADCCSRRNGLTNSRREQPNVPTNEYADRRRHPHLAKIDLELFGRRCLKLRHAHASARNAGRSDTTARSVRKTSPACCRTKSWGTTSQLPRCHQNRSLSQTWNGAGGTVAGTQSSRRIPGAVSPCSACAPLPRGKSTNGEQDVRDKSE
jgi:hypothetical protein